MRTAIASLIATLLLATQCFADLTGDPHVHVSALSLGGGLIQYTIDMDNPLGGGVAVEVCVTGNINQFDTDGVIVNIPPIGDIVLIPPGEVNFEDEATIADGDPTYFGLGGKAADSWWDRSLLTVPNPPFGAHEDPCDRIPP